MVGLGQSSAGVARRGRARCGVERQARRGMAGEAWPCTEKRSGARRGVAKFGRNGKARPGVPRRGGRGRRGVAGQGMVRRGGVRLE